MTNVVRGEYGSYSFVLTYKDRRLVAIKGTHVCFCGGGHGILTLRCLGKSVFLTCESCDSSLHFGDEINNLPPPGKYDDKIYLTHACTKCEAAMVFYELLDAEHSLCAKCKTPRTPDCIKVTFNLAAEFYTFLSTLARERGITMTEAIHQCINTEKFLHEQQKNGCKVLLEHPDGNFTLLTFR